MYEPARALSTCRPRGGPPRRRGAMEALESACRRKIFLEDVPRVRPEDRDLTVVVDGEDVQRPARGAVARTDHDLHRAPVALLDRRLRLGSETRPHRRVRVEVANLPSPAPDRAVVEA